MKIFHPDTQWERVFTHIYHGLIPTAACWLATTGGIPLAIAACAFAGLYLYQFVKYEQNEDLHTKDQAWNDYLGCKVGLNIVFWVYVVWRLLS